MWADETLTVGWGLVGIIVKNALQALIQFLSEDPQFMDHDDNVAAGGLRPTALVGVVADHVPSGIRLTENESSIASTLTNLATFVEEPTGRLGSKPAGAGPD